MNAKMARSIKKVEPGLGDILDSIYLCARRGNREYTVSQDRIGEEEIYQLNKMGYKTEFDEYTSDLTISW
jgi:hypothetical protein